MRIFEMFILDGEQIIVDLIAVMLDLRRDKLLELTELALMNYIRKDIVSDVFSEHSVRFLLGFSPLVELTSKKWSIIKVTATGRPLEPS